MTVDELVAATEPSMRAAADPAHATGVRNFFIEPVDPRGVRSADLKPIEQMVYREKARFGRGTRGAGAAV